MTNQTSEAAIVPPAMKLLALTGCLLLLAISALPLPAQDAPDLRTLLRDALFTEEVTRDAEKAAQQYEQLLARHAENQAFAATALFRLAEVRRKQNRNDEAIALYQRLLREFPVATTEAKLATENLAALGAKPLDPTTPTPLDDDARELRRLQDLIASSPDRLRDPDLLLTAVKEGRLASVEFLLKAGAAAVPWQLLNEAVLTGNLRTTALILDFPFGNAYRGLPEALFTAVTLDYQDVTKLLLARGAAPTKQGSYRIAENTIPPTTTTALMSALHVAVRKRNLDLCKLLLDHKADPNELAARPTHPDRSYANPPAGTPLHDAVLTSLEITRLLIERGANVNAASDVTGVTPLHLAVRVDENEDIIRLLIEKGASLDAAILNDPPSSPSGSRSRAPYQMPELYAKGSTPLQAAITLGRIPAARQLIEAGASVKHPGILLAAVHLLQPALVDDLLQKGALDAKFPTHPIRHIACKTVTPEQIPAALEILNLLIKHGAKPDPEWIDQFFTDAHPRYLPLLHRHFLMPSLLQKPAITAVYPSLGLGQSDQLASNTSNEPPPPLATLLLQSKFNRPVAVIWTDNQRQEHHLTQLTRWRKDPDGSMQPLHIDLTGSDPLPDLQWGDVLEFSPDWEKIGGQTNSFNVEFRTSPPPKIAWALRKRISFPITVEIDGKTRNITLRGDRITFDPGSDEAPLLGASQLMSLLWQPPFKLKYGESPKLTLIRKDWPEVDVPWGKTDTSDITLQAVDKLRLASPPTPKEAEKLRSHQLLITSPGTSFTRRYGVMDYDYPLPTSIPTLTQALADLTGDWNKLDRAPPSNPAELENWLNEHAASLVPLRFLPHPDYSKIRIRRLNDDGSETTIPVDLTGIIAKPDLTPEAARKADISLQFGDIVEIPQKSDQSGKPYRGPTPEEAAFFAKALDCRIQFTEGSNAPVLRQIQYQPPRYVEFHGNWIPLWPLSGTPSLNATIALGTDVEITRNETGSIPGSWHYLRDGDIVRSQRSPRARSVVPPQPQPRPAVVPPPFGN